MILGQTGNSGRTIEFGPAKWIMEDDRIDLTCKESEKETRQQLSDKIEGWVIRW